ncbi:MAG: hypothetical protein M3Z04_15630 [Chloroflexota bacterium]|nr:hypothetical protein [Chloroflexota bacterium]
MLKMVLLVAVPALGLIALVLAGRLAILFPAPVSAPAGGDATQLTGLVYVDRAGAIQRWDAATGQATLVVAAASGDRILLAATDDGAALAYIQTDPAFTPRANGSSDPAYTLHVWRAGFAPRTLPITAGTAHQVLAVFRNSGSLAVLIESSLHTIGPLYLADLDAGQVQQVTDQIDSFAVGANSLVYAQRLPVPTPRVQTRPSVDRGLLGIYQPGGGGSSLVITASLASRQAATVQIAYLPVPGVFAFPLWQYTAGNVDTQLHLRALRPDTPGAVADLPLQSPREEASLNFSPDGHYLLYGGVIRHTARGLPVVESRGDRDWRIATLDWTGLAPRIVSDQPFTIPSDLAPSGLNWVPGGTTLALSGAQLISDTVRGAAYARLDAPQLRFYDPATGVLDLVPAEQAATALAALPAGRVLLGGATTEGPSLLLADHTTGTWQTRPLGAPFPGGVAFYCLGLLPDGAALIITYDPQPTDAPFDTLYRVPLDGKPRVTIGEARGMFLPLRGR